MSGWKTFRVGDLVEPVKSWNPLCSESDDTFQYIDLSAVDQSLKRIVGAREVPCAEAPSRAKQLVKANDVLVSTVRPNLNGVAQVGQELDGSTASTGFCVLRPRANLLSSSYLFHWVKTEQFIADMVRKATGASYPAVSEKTILESTIAAPPIAEQRRIATILDQADALRAKRREALAQLDSLTQSIFIEMFGDPITNPKGWPRVKFASLLANIDSGWSPVCMDRAAEGEEWGVLKLGAVTSCKYKDSENKALPEGVPFDPKIEVKSGDLLFSRKNTYDLVAACALVESTRENLMLSDLIFRFRLNSDAKIEKHYLQSLLVFPSKRSEVQKLAGGSSGSMPNISKGRLLELEIELPPLPLQRTFTSRIRSAEALKSSHNAALQELDRLFASLQHRAFSGEL